MPNNNQNFMVTADYTSKTNKYISGLFSVAGAAALVALAVLNPLTPFMVMAGVFTGVNVLGFGIANLYEYEVNQKVKSQENSWGHSVKNQQGKSISGPER